MPSNNALIALVTVCGADDSLNAVGCYSNYPQGTTKDVK